jgi:hypothetical protein
MKNGRAAPLILPLAKLQAAKAKVDAMVAALSTTKLGISHETLKRIARGILARERRIPRCLQ